MTPDRITPERIEHLIGGYASGTLTKAERDMLFGEAMKNQSLFDALADEEALRDALADPAFRARLRESLTATAAKPFWSRLEWPKLDWPGLAWPLAGSFAVATLSIIAFFAIGPRRDTEPSQQIALNQPSVTAPAAPAPASPAPNAPPPASKPDTFSRDGRETDVRETKARADRQAPAAPAAPPAETPAPPAETPAHSGPAQPRVVEELAKAKGEKQTIAVDELKDSPRPNAERELAEFRAEQKVTASGREAAPARAASQPAAAATTAGATTADTPGVALPQLPVYRIERLNPDGSHSTVNPTQLSAGDRVRLVLTAPEPTAVNVTLAGSDTAAASSTLLFQGPVLPGTPVYIPSTGTLPNDAGTRALLIKPVATSPLTGNSSLTGNARLSGAAASGKRGREVRIPLVFR